MIAAGLVQNGATVYITSRKAAACEQAARELSSLSSGSGGSCIALPPMDLADGVNAEQKLQDALAAAGVTKMNILVNNSGVCSAITPWLCALTDECRRLGDSHSTSSRRRVCTPRIAG